MREILFRGKKWNTSVWDETEWVYGSLIDSGNHEQVAIYPWVNGASSMSVRQLVHARMESVKHETLGQYTGLTDKNGKRIFEGDIIKIRFEGDAEPPSTPPVWYETGKVIWHEQLHGWYVVFDSPDGIPIQEYDDCDDVFVIGNVHDNPELMEVET